MTRHSATVHLIKLTCSQGRRQSTWKPCLQGRKLLSSPISNFFRQMGQDPSSSVQILRFSSSSINLLKFKQYRKAATAFRKAAEVAHYHRLYTAQELCDFAQDIAPQFKIWSFDLLHLSLPSPTYSPHSFTSTPTLQLWEATRQIYFIFTYSNTTGTKLNSIKF